MIELITQNIYSIALLAITIGVLFYLYKTGRKVLAKSILKELVLKAEIYYKSGQGNEKKDYVVEEFYNRVKILSAFLSRKELEDLIELLVEEIKEKL